MSKNLAERPLLSFRGFSTATRPALRIVFAKKMKLPYV